MTPSLSPQNLVNTLMNMYSSNARQIENLQQANLGIRNDITSILLRIINNNNNNTHSNNNNTHSNNNNNNSNNSNYSNNNSNSRRLRSHDNNQRENISSTFNSVFQSFFEPIQIFPTPTQIENAVRIARFSDIVTPINNSCPIILERFNDNDNVSVIRNCNHIFNTSALNSWFTSNCRCPVCRYDIRNYTPTHANTNTNTNTNANPTNANITTNTNTNANTNANSTANTNTNANANTNANIPNISNIQYDVTSDSVTFDINNDDFYNNLTRLALNSLYGINNNVRDASGNNVRDASGNNNVRDPSGNQT
jgi:hypothetical protein